MNACAADFQGADAESSGAHNITKPRRRGKTLLPEEQERRLALYRAGMTDMQIAEVCGLTPKGIEEWRRRNGLPGNGMRRRGRPAPERAREASKREPAPMVASQEVASERTPEPRPATAARRTPRHRIDPTDFDPMLIVDIKTGEILIDRRPDYLRRGAAEREARRAKQATEQAAADSVGAGARLQGRSGG